MTDSQTLRALMEACSQTGCPVCIVVQVSVERYFSGLFYESILDPIIRRRLRTSLGVCQKHARLVLDEGLSDALGLAIVYEDLVGVVLESNPTGTTSIKNLKKDALHSLEPAKPCPGCLQEKESTQRVIAALTDSLLKAEFRQVFENSDGLCLPHLHAAITHTSNRQILLGLLDVQMEKMTELRHQLSEFIRKNDYRFRNEAFGKERDAYRRAIEMIVGMKYHKPE
jgi:hypothetical protein